MASTNFGYNFTVEANFLGKVIPLLFERDAKKIDNLLRDQFNKAVYSWPQTTERLNGDTVGSPRDIVDTGATRDSQKMLWENRFTVRWEWDSPAAIIYEGRIDTDKYPARPFIDDALSNAPALNYISLNFRGGLGTS